jgi:hypothetical protein
MFFATPRLRWNSPKRRLLGLFFLAPVGDRLDRGRLIRVQFVLLAAALLLATSWLLLVWTPKSLLSLAIGAVVLDLAVQAVHVSNQSRIYPHARTPAAG